MFFSAARAMGGDIDGDDVRFERGGRILFASWQPRWEAVPPHLRIMTKACAISTPRSDSAGDVPRGGPFRSVAAEVEIESPAPLTLRLETARDRTGKGIQLNRETQTGDAEFDARVYLETDAPDAVVMAVLGDPGMRAGALKCMTLGCTWITLHENGDLVALRLLPDDEDLTAEILGALLDALGATAEGIPPLQRERDFRRPLAEMPAYCSLVAIGSVPLCWIVNQLWKPLGSDFYASGALAGVALWIVALPILFVLLRGHPASLRRLVVSAVFLLVGLPIAGIGVLVTLNAALDRSAPEVHETHVIAQNQAAGKGARQWLTFVSWHPGEQTINIDVNRDDYREFSPPAAVTVTLRHGFLGWERVVSITRSSEPQPSN
jgi:hypothetical protein